ncbi:ABC transporter substrate-binding protein [Halomicroarcula sp. GCM10025709]|uniref:ABC transporter substrate-binding protein n=2 Tax=Halomicroarcula sp. GCM10025709 TaxID=3252669 RepID=UPI00361BAB68
MSGQDHSRQSRRDILMKGSSALAGTVLLAGCSGTEGAGGQAETETETPTDTATSTPGDDSDGTETTTENRYTAAMEPVGELTLDEPPEFVIGGWGFVADVLTALGHGDKIKAMRRANGAFWFTRFYEELPGVPVRDLVGMPAIQTRSRDLKREYLFGLDADLFAIDPNTLIASHGLSHQDISTLEDRVAPFFGNDSRDKRGTGWPNYPDEESYPYYTIPEFVEKYGELFGEREKAAELNEFYENAIDRILSDVPDEKRNVAHMSAMRNPEDAGFYAVSQPTPDHDLPTYARKQYREIGVEDAFAGEYEGGTLSRHGNLQIDSEKLAAIDPEVIIFSEGSGSNTATRTG